MCLEDLQVGRRRTSRIRSVTAGLVAIKLTDRSPTRVGLILSSHPTSQLTVGEGDAVTALAGLHLPPLSAPLVLSVEQHGDLVTKELWIISNVAASLAGIVEIDFDLPYFRSHFERSSGAAVEVFHAKT